DETVEKALAGIVGAATAFQFSEFVKNKAGPDARSFLADFEAAREELEAMPPHELTNLNESFFRIIEVEEDPAQLKRHIQNLEGYVRWLTEGKRNEVLAHWTTLYESSLYPKTKIAILSNSPFIFQNIIGFIEGIKL
ncbi:MAG: ATPase, partial [Treponema sp.]|nr:ATPase [Treponema sp.]